MSAKNYRTISILLMVSSIVVIGLFLYGYAAKPELSYQLSTIIDYNETHNFSTDPLPITLNIQNIGDSPVDTDILVRLYNSSIVGYDFVDYGFYKEVKIKMNEKIQPGGKINFTVYFMFESGYEYVAMLFSPVPKRDFNPVNSFEESFTGLILNRPTAILMKQVNGSEYMRISSR